MSVMSGWCRVDVDSGKSLFHFLYVIDVLAFTSRSITVLMVVVSGRCRVDVDSRKCSFCFVIVVGVLTSTWGSMLELLEPPCRSCWVCVGLCRSRVVDIQISFFLSVG